MKLIASLFTLTLAFTLSACIINVNAVNSGPLKHQQKQLQIAAANINTFITDTGAGDLTIQGVEGLSKISVVADIYTYQDTKAELALAKSGNQATLVAKFNHQINFNHSPYIDLTIQVPAQMALKIQDGSGDIKIHNTIANIELIDGSGDINIHGGKTLNITDGSGAILIKKTTGALTLKDGSGEITLKKIGGNTTITDGSGDINATYINGHLVIDDGSGDITVNHSQGLRIIDSGSGDVDIDNINGPTKID